MGRLAIMMVMGLSLTIGVVGYQISVTNSRSVEHVAGFHKYTTARNIAHQGVNMALRAFDRYPPDTSLGGTLSRNQVKVFANSYLNGICTSKVWYAIPGVSDSLWLSSKSRFMDTSYTMLLKIRRTPVPFPSIGAAVGLDVANLTWSMVGTPTISGFDHDSTGAVLATGGVPGVSVVLASDTTKPLADASKIDGSTDVTADPGMVYPGSMAEVFIQAANFTYVGPRVVSSNLTWGSPSTPVVVYADARAGAIKFSGNITGWGILVCRGNLELSGTFKFYGLVIAYNDVTLKQDVSLSAGTPTIIGAFIMAGAPGSSFTLKGNDAILYSSWAIKKAMLIGSLQTYRVSDWFE